jgi:hypothetical protein
LRDLAALLHRRLDLRERRANRDEKRRADQSPYQRLPDRCLLHDCTSIFAYCRHPARLSFQACKRAAGARKTFALFLLATLRHTGSVHINLLDTPCLLRIFLLHCAAFLKGFHPRVIHGRSGVAQLDQRRRAKQDGEGESGS